MIRKFEFMDVCSFDSADEALRDKVNELIGIVNEQTKTIMRLERDLRNEQYIARAARRGSRIGAKTILASK